MTIEELVIINADWIRRRALIYYSNHSDAEDLASETICKCLSQGSSYDQKRSFRPWACAIMQNTYITQYNRRKCVLFSGLCDYELYEGKEYADQLASVNRIHEIVEQCRHKTCGIESLMLYAEGYSYDEIARMLDISYATAKSRARLGRELLKRVLEL